MSNFITGRNFGSTIQTSDIADNAITVAKMGDDSVTQAEIGDQAINEARMQISNSPTNGHFLSAQSGNTGGMTWAAAGGGWIFVSAVTASNSATVSFTGFETGYDYRIDFYNLLPVSDGMDVYLQLGVSGPTYRTSGYLSVSGGHSNTGASSGVSHTTVMMLTTENNGNAADEHGYGYVEIKDPASATDTFMFGHGANTSSAGNEYLWSSGSHHTTAEAMNAVKIYMQSGNLSTGEFKLYKRANA